MEELQTRLNRLTPTSEYRFKASLVKEILEEFKLKMSQKETFEQAVQIDENHHPVHVSHEKIMEIIDEFINIDNFETKFSPTQIIDGYGNIAVTYNGNPYLTLKLLLMAFRTHNNIVFFSKRYYAINTKIVETLNIIASKKNYANRISFVEFDVIDDALVNYQRMFDLVIYIGEKRSYPPIRKRITVPVIYSGYGNVDIFVEDKSFKDLLLKINEYENTHDVNISYYDNSVQDEIVKFINKYELTDCFVMLSKNTELIYEFISNIKAKHVYINSYPFDKYELEISEKDLVYRKNIIMN